MMRKSNIFYRKLQLFVVEYILCSVHVVHYNHIIEGLKYNYGLFSQSRSHMKIYCVCKCSLALVYKISVSIQYKTFFINQILKVQMSVKI